MRPELTFEEFCAQRMELVMHISGNKEHYMHRFNRETGVNKVTVTQKKKNGDYGNPSVIYYIADDPTNYNTADQIYVAYMQKVCGVKPCCSPYCECSAGACEYPNYYDDRDRR